ncbi:hypothetical protein V8C26DRAFT_308788 [Trichoderma gracile]
MLATAGSLLIARPLVVFEVRLCLLTSQAQVCLIAHGVHRAPSGQARVWMSWQLWPQSCRIEPPRHVKERKHGWDKNGYGHGHKLRYGRIIKIKGAKRHQRAGLAEVEYEAVTRSLYVQVATKHKHGVSIAGEPAHVGALTVLAASDGLDRRSDLGSPPGWLWPCFGSML